MVALFLTGCPAATTAGLEGRFAGIVDCADNFDNFGSRDAEIEFSGGAAVLAGQRVSVGDTLTVGDVLGPAAVTVTSADIFPTEALLTFEKVTIADFGLVTDSVERRYEMVGGALVYREVTTTRVEGVDGQVVRVCTGTLERLP